MMAASRLRFDHGTDRWLLDSTPLHGGDTLQVCIGGQWLPARVEHEDRAGWVLVLGDGARVLPGGRLPVRPDPRDRHWSR